MTLLPTPGYRPRYESLPRTVTAVPSEGAYGEQVAAHSHPWVQLLYASEGVMRVRTELGVWIIPPRRALLIAPGVVHELTMLSRVNQRTLYIGTEAAGDLVEGCKVLEVSPLLRELILALSTEPVDYPEDSRGEHLARLILLELRRMETVPIAVPWPRDRRLQALCTDIMDHPGSQRTLEDRALDAGASARTLIRLFPKETGLHYRQWVQQVHLAHAFAMLARGEGVGTIARTLGYASPSAFTSMFRRLLGRTPQHYLAEWRGV
ncbi:AraC family transcriptional regulator [Massilia sp. TN1-12]|uniref:AraC family transcriptional regulator n=1 Tax=Massilia paldalensis TaxID=3377675 RepID=UPI00384F3393